MEYKPNKKNFKAIMLCGTSGTFAVALFLSSAFVNSYRWAFQLCGLILAVIAVQIFTINLQSDYVYKAGENDLMIYRITGNKSLCVCSLSYEESLSYVVTMSYYSEHKEEFPKYTLAVNYCKNISPNEYHLYFFNFNGKVTKLKFEPNEDFVNYINQRLEIALNNKKIEENENE